MAYHSETVAATMNKINQQYFLPAIQREFVWTADQIIELFDSVMRGYPVGSFLYWDLLPGEPRPMGCLPLRRRLQAGREPQPDRRQQSVPVG